MKSPGFNRFGPVIVVGVLAVLLAPSASVLWACSVPMFRYALEQWSSDKYVVEVVHSGALSGEAKAAAALLERFSGGEEQTPVNITVRYVDTEKQAGEAGQQEAIEPGEARMVVYFPAVVFRSKPIWSEPLTREGVGKLVDSPVRREIVRRLLNGDSVVWVLLESGDRQKDDAAAAVLEQELKVMADGFNLTFYAGPEDDDSYSPENELTLRIAFSLVRLRRDDPEEAFLATCLVRTEPDLAEFNEPIVFPVFGRGRALYALVGRGIHKNNIVRASQLLCEGCSCITKGQNPGMDLLLSGNWDEHLGRLFSVEADLPPLVGIADLAASEEGSSGTAASVDTASTTETEPGDNKLIPRVLLVLGLSLAFVVIGTFAVRRTAGKKKECA